MLWQGLLPVVVGEGAKDGDVALSIRQIRKSVFDVLLQALKVLLECGQGEEKGIATVIVIFRDGEQEILTVRSNRPVTAQKLHALGACQDAWKKLGLRPAGRSGVPACDMQKDGGYRRGLQFRDEIAHVPIGELGTVD